MSTNSERDEFEEETYHPPHEEHEEEEGEPWLVSYADMMTLLFGFFVILYTFASAKVDTEVGNTVKMREEIAKYFGGQIVDSLDGVSSEFKNEVSGTPLGGEFDMRLVSDALEVTFLSTVSFRSGSASLLPEAEKALLMLINILKSKTVEFFIEVEGHTDNVPLRESSAYPSNWELSGARASTVVRLFESQGFPPKHLKAVGFGASRPILPNTDKNGTEIIANQARNRRVKIKIFKTTSEQVDDTTDSQSEPQKSPDE